MESVERSGKLSDMPFTTTTAAAGSAHCSLHHACTFLYIFVCFIADWLFFQLPTCLSAYFFWQKKESKKLFSYNSTNNNTQGQFLHKKLFLLLYPSICHKTFSNSHNILCIMIAHILSVIYTYFCPASYSLRGTHACKTTKTNKQHAKTHAYFIQKDFHSFQSFIFSSKFFSIPLSFSGLSISLSLSFRHCVTWVAPVLFFLLRTTKTTQAHLFY